MLTVREHTRTAGEEWDAFVLSQTAATSYHLWDWRHVLGDALGHTPVYLSARQEGRVVGILPLIQLHRPFLGDQLVSLPFVNYGGIVAPDPGVADALEAAALLEARRRRVVGLELRQREACVRTRLRAQNTRVALELPLPGTGEALQKQIGAKLRNQIRKADKAGLQVRRGGTELLDDFYRVFAENMHELGSPVWGKRFFHRVLSSFPDRARIYVCDLNTRPVAVGLTFRFKQITEIPWASALREFNPLCANVRLYWEILREANADGYACFDFGRSAPDSGTFHFKRHWGAEVKPLHWYVWPATERGLSGDLVSMRPRLEAAWRQLPHWSTRLLGPPLRRLLAQ